MKKLIIYCVVFLLIIFNCSCKQDHSFRIVLLPDTQHYSESYPEIFYAQTDWIAANSDSIAFVLHQGDITNHNTPKEWDVAAGAMNRLEGKVPYVISLGNHDIGTNGTADVRNTENFNKWFPYEKHCNSDDFGGAFEEGEMENVWYTIEAGGINWLILSLEYGPRNKVLNWASEVIENHPLNKVIINTHAYMYSDDTRMSEARDHKWLPRRSGMNKNVTGDEDVNNGEQMWGKLVSRYPNIMFVFSGHVLNDGTGVLVSEGKHGNKVYQMLANYQNQENGGNGFLRIITIDPDKGNISVKSYSPYTDAYKTDSSQEFEFNNVKF